MGICQQGTSYWIEILQQKLLISAFLCPLTSTANNTKGIQKYVKNIHKIYKKNIVKTLLSENKFSIEKY